MSMDELVFTVRARAMLTGKPVYHVIEQLGGRAGHILAVCPWLDDALRVALALSQAEGGVVNNEVDKIPSPVYAPNGAYAGEESESIAVQPEEGDALSLDEPEVQPIPESEFPLDEALGA